MTSLTLFCKVVDNYGDIGICWRLAKQLAAEHPINVTLWVNDLISFQRLCRAVNVDSATQQINGITVQHWRDQNGLFDAVDVGDIVIEFLGCDIPPSYIAAMAARVPQPVWLNFEGLSAEQWVEGCHTLSSPHPRLSLTKYFFFPGFTNKTGGLLCENGLLQQRQVFQQSPAEISAFLAQFGVTASELTSTKISLFCYPHAPVLALFDVWQKNASAVTCFIPEGVATAALQQWFGYAPTTGTHLVRGALTVRVLPFMSQPDYDKLLWACDVNFVRGEDSFVRAQWANRPFVWHIYPQDNNLHHVKLNAFLQRYTAKTASLVDFTLSWNAVIDQPVAAIWPSFQADIPLIASQTFDWPQQLISHGDLAANLMKFCESIR